MMFISNVLTCFKYLDLLYLLFVMKSTRSRGKPTPRECERRGGPRRASPWRTSSPPSSWSRRSSSRRTPPGMMMSKYFCLNLINNFARTTELQQLVINSPGGGASPAPASPALPGSTATGTTVTTTATLVAGGGQEADRHERRPSWRLRMESNDKNRVSTS